MTPDEQDDSGSETPSPWTRRLLLVALLGAGAVLARRVHQGVLLKRARAALAAAAAAMQSRDYPAALAQATLAHGLPPAEEYRARVLRAHALESLQRPQEAAAALESALAIGPRAWDAPYGLARLAMRELNNCPEGLKTLEAALAQPEERYWSKSAERIHVHRLRWRCHQALGDVERASSDQSQELALRTGAGETTGEEVRLLLSSRAWSSYMLYEKVMARLAKGEWREVYRERFRQEPNSPEAKGQAEAVPFQHLGQAEADANAALGMKDEAGVRLLRARILVAGGKPDLALADLAILGGSAETAATSEYWTLTASAQGQRKSYRAALEAVERAISLDPSNAEAQQMKPMLLELLSSTAPPRPPKKRRRQP